jgi:hypothetical protein
MSCWFQARFDKQEGSAVRVGRKKQGRKERNSICAAGLAGHCQQRGTISVQPKA